MTESETSATIGWRFYLVWLVAFAGFPLGGLLAYGLVGPMDGVITGAAAGILAGAVIGVAQWLALRRYAGVRTEWIVHTATGLGIGNATGTVLTGAGTGLGDLVVLGLCAGLATGVAQWLLLRPRIPAAYRWIPAMTTCWPIGWTVTWAAGVDVERGYAVFGATGAVVFAALSGAALWWLLGGTNPWTREGKAA